MRQILEEMQMCLSEMIVTMHERGSVHPSQGDPVTHPMAREKVLYCLYSFDAAVAGALRQLERVDDDELLTGHDKENHRLRIQLRLDVKFDDLTTEIRRHIGPVDIWKTPIRHGDLPTAEHLQIKNVTMEQFRFIQQALFPMNELLRDYVWKGVC
jgi:hypothetical protein